MKIITNESEINSFLLSLGLDSDGGNCAIVGARKLITIDSAHHVGGRLWYSLTYQSIDYAYEMREFDNLIELRVYDSQESAMSDYVSRITQGADVYLSNLGH